MSKDTTAQSAQDQTPHEGRTNSELIRDLMKGRWWLLVVAVFSIIISAVASYCMPLVIRLTIDSIIGTEALDAPLWVQNLIASVGGTMALRNTLWMCSLVLIGLALINSVCAYIRGHSSAKVGELIAEDLRNNLYDHIQHLDYQYHINAETGDLLQRSSSDVNWVRRTLSSQLVEVVRIIVSSIVGVVLMASLSPQLTVFSCIMIPIIFIFCFTYQKKMQVAYTEIQEADAKLSTVIQESLSGVRVVRAFGQQQQEMQKFDKTNGGLRDSIIKINKLSGFFWGGSDVIIYAQMALVTALSSYFVLKGAISIGTMIAFVSYIGMLLWPLRQLGRILADLTKAGVALKRIREILNVPTEPTTGIIGKQPLRGNIEFRNVSFRYGADAEVLKDISFSVKEGQTVAILGATGSGKSTLLYLLQHLYDYDSGSITIDGTEITEFNRKWLRKNVGLVLQEPFLYSRNLKNNITITKPDATEEQMTAAIEAAALSGMVREFEKGLETAVGERGVTLSGGQQQRVAIARTLIQETPILLFDDSLSAVDTETDQMIRTALKKREHNATTFIVSHRITTLAEADLILIMEDGRIVQQGTHDVLSKTDGLYRRVWDIQGAEEEQAFDF